MTPRAGRPPRWAAGFVVLVVAVCLAVGGWLLLRPDTYVAIPASPERAAARPDLAAAALDDLVRAVTGHDGEEAAALGADPTAADLLRAVVANAAALDVTGFTARYVDESGAVTPDGRWSAAVDLGWRFAGYDDAPVREEVQVGFAADGDRAAVTGFGVTGAAASGDRTPLWLTGPVQVRKGDGTLVLATTAAAADRYAGLARRAVAVVGRVVTGWTGPLVIEVPGTQRGLEAALGASSGTYAGVAAVTASVDGSTGKDAPVHVFVNPDVMAGLDRQGAQIVISHEATHVATGAAIDNPRPIWLTEGFADYVALRDVDLPLSTTAGQILAQVRKSGPPAHLPQQADFDSHSDSFGAEYEAAWLVCRVIAERAGEQALVAVYDRVGAGEDLQAVLRDELGFGTRGLTRLWQRRLSDWAR